MESRGQKLPSPTTACKYINPFNLRSISSIRTLSLRYNGIAIISKLKAKAQKGEERKEANLTENGVAHNSHSHQIYLGLCTLNYNCKV